VEHGRIAVAGPGDLVAELGADAVAADVDASRRKPRAAGLGEQPRQLAALEVGE
jgi:hypothetical protein